jgi:hypothetical protein
MCAYLDNTQLLELAINTIATLIAAFTGAWVAFKFESWRRKQETIERQIAAANRALYTIFNLWNVLRQFQKESIEPVRGNEDNWLNMNATLHASYGLTSFQVDELAFFLQTEHVNIYADLLLEEQRFWIAVRQIEMRSSIVLNEVFPKMAASKVSVDSRLTEHQIENIIGIDVQHKLKEITSGIIKNVDENVISLIETHDKLRAAMKSIYPKKKFVTILFQ